MAEHTGHDEHAHINKEHKKIKKIHVWQAVSALLGILLIISIFASFSAKERGTLSADEAANKAIRFINANVLQEGQTAVLKNVGEEGQLYKVRISIDQSEFDSYVTKNGKLLFPNVIDMDTTPGIEPEQPAQDTPKKEITEVDLFVMSYCPYGMQAQEALVPVMKLLGNKADINVRFVNYIMHGKKEIDENNVQYCIQKEEKDKYAAYLKCFLESKNSEDCLKEAGIDKSVINSCIEAADKEFSITADYEDKESWLSGRFSKYRVDDELNQKYGVRGSPTLIINGVTYSGARTSEAFKKAICAGFEEPPEECEDVLSSTEAAAEGSCG